MYASQYFSPLQINVQIINYFIFFDVDISMFEIIYLMLQEIIYCAPSFKAEISIFALKVIKMIVIYIVIYINAL